MPDFFAEKTIEQLKKSKRPALLVGNGVRQAGQIDTLYKILERIKLPVLTTWRALDLFAEDYPLYCGRPGMIAERGPNAVQQNADLLITLGARLDLCQVGFNYPNFAPKATAKIIVDCEYNDLNKFKLTNFYNFGTKLEQFLPELLDEIEKQDFNLDRMGWVAQGKSWREQFPLEAEKTEYISLYTFYDKLSSCLTSDDIIVLGSSGSIAEVGCQALKIHHRGTRVINTPGLGSMGYGLSAAIGVAVASGKRVICIDGDGSFAMNLQELATVKGLNLPIIVFLWNNQGYNSIINSQTNLCDNRLLGVNKKSGLHLPDYEKVVRGFGINYFKLVKHIGSPPANCDGNPLDILQFLIKTIKCPFVCEIFGNPDHITQPRTKTYKDENGNLVSSTLENMWPFI